MSQWACTDGMSDDELSPTTVVLHSPSPCPPNQWVQVGEKSKPLTVQNSGSGPGPLPVTTSCSLSSSPTPSPTKSDHFYTDGCGDRPYVDKPRPRARSQSPPAVPERVPVNSSEFNESTYPKRNYQYYKEPRIVVDYTSDLSSVRVSGTKQDYISSTDVFSHISLGGRLPRNLMSTLDGNICDNIFHSFTGTEEQLKEFTNFYWRKEGVSSRYNINCVASAYDGLAFLTRNYDIVLAECTKAFLKYNDQVIY
jgi:hypothetical protein